MQKLLDDNPPSDDSDIDSSRLKVLHEGLASVLNEFSPKTAHLHRLNRGAHIAADDSVASLVTIDTNLVLAQRDRMLAGLDKYARGNRDDLRRTSVQSDSLFDPRPFLDQVRQDQQFQVQHRTLEHFLQHSARRGTHSGAQGNTRGGRGGRGRGQSYTRYQPSFRNVRSGGGSRGGRSRGRGRGNQFSIGDKSKSK